MADSKEVKEWVEFLATKKITDLVDSDFKLVFIDTEARFGEVMWTLLDNNILSVPIFNKHTHKFVGSVDLLDLLTYAVTVFSETLLLSSDFLSHLRDEKKLDEEKYGVKFLSDLSLRDPWCPVWIDLPLLSLMDMFSKQVNLHRVPLVDEDGYVIGLISQSRVVDWIHENVSKVPAVILNKTVGDLITEQGTKGKVVTVRDNMRTSEAYKVLLDSEVSSVAVVNEAGELVGNLSSSDLKGTKPGRLFEQFYFPVHKFIGEAARRFGRDTTWPICCTEEETLEMALEKLTAKHIHRVYIIDHEKKPIGVLSLCDFITQLQYGENL